METLIKKIKNLSAYIFVFAMAFTMLTLFLTSNVWATDSSSDEHLVRDSFFSMDNESVNRQESEHFQIIWGNENDENWTQTIDDTFAKEQLVKLESIWDCYVNGLQMTEICYSTNEAFGDTKCKTNIYIANTGLGSVIDNNADCVLVDAGGFGYMVLNPEDMNQDNANCGVEHKLAHVFIYHQNGLMQDEWCEAMANWFKDQYMGSSYNDNGVTSDFFDTYILNSDYYFPHSKNYYEAWPILLYISENPDNIEGLGMDLIHKILENDTEYSTIFEAIEKISGASVKEILGGLSKRLVTMDFTRQTHYLAKLDEVLLDTSSYDKIYTTLTEGNNGYLLSPTDRAPMQGGYNIVPLDVDLSNTCINVEFVGTSAATNVDYRVTIVTKTASNYTRYSDTWSSGTGSIILHGDEEAAYLVVCATPDEMVALSAENETAQGTRYPYKVKVATSAEEPTEETTEESTEEESTEAETEEETTEEETTEVETEEETTTSAFGTPKNLKVAIYAANSVRLTWDVVDGAEKYMIYRKAEGEGIFSFKATVTTNEWINTGLTTGKKYTYYIVANKGLEFSNNSEEATIKAGVTKPGNAKAEVIAPKKIKLTWKKSDNAIGYQVLRKAEGESKFTVRTTIKSANTLTWTDTSIEKGVKYTYKVVGYVNNYKKVKVRSAANEIKITAGMTKIAKVSVARAGKNKVKVTWTKSTGAAGYQIYRKTGKGDFVLAGTVTGNKLTFVDKRASEAEKNIYRVYPYVKVRGKKVQGPFAVSVEIKAGLTKVTNLKATSVKNGVRLNWKKVTDADGYLIMAKRPGQADFKQIANVKKLFYKDLKASKTAVTKYRIIAYYKNEKGVLVKAPVSATVSAIAK